MWTRTNVSAGPVRAKRAGNGADKPDNVQTLDQQKQFTGYRDQDVSIAANQGFSILPRHLRFVLFYPFTVEMFCFAGVYVVNRGLSEQLFSPSVITRI